MTAIATATLITGLLIFLISLPLIYRRIPRNGVYGIRIPAAFESDQRWYDINAYGGRLLARWSWVIVAAGVCGFFVPQTDSPVYPLACVAVMLLAVFIPIIQILRWSRKP
jgi:hypothetical protein